MIDPVLINFAVGGMREVDRAFDTLDKRMARFERDTGKSVSSGSASRVRATETETQRREKAYAKLVRDIEKDERAATKAAETQARARDLLHRRSSEAAGRYAHKAAEDEVKAAKATVKEIERLEAYKMRVRIRSSEQAGRIAAREASTEAATRKKIAHATGGILSRGVGNAAGGAASAVGMAASIGGGLTNEIPAAQKLFAEIDLANRVVTLDAMHCKKNFRGGGGCKRPSDRSAQRKPADPVRARRGPLPQGSAALGRANDRRQVSQSP